MNGRRIVAIRAHGLLGIFDYSIHLNLLDRITILHGPNGCGKSTLFALISSLLARDFSTVRRLPFGRVTLDFTDGSRATVFTSFAALAAAKKDGGWVERYQAGEVDPCEGSSLYFEIAEDSRAAPKIYELTPSKFRNVLDPSETEPDRSQLPEFSLGPYDPDCARDPTTDEHGTWLTSLYAQAERTFLEKNAERKMQFDGYDLPPRFSEQLGSPKVVLLGTDRLLPQGASADSGTGGRPGILLALERMDEVRKQHQDIIDRAAKEFADSFDEHLKRRMLAGEATVQPLDELVSQLAELVTWFGLSEYWTVVGDPAFDEGPENYLWGLRKYEGFPVFFDRPDLENRVALTLLVEHLAELERILNPCSAKYNLIKSLFERLMWKDLLDGTLHINAPGPDGGRYQKPISPIDLSSGEQHLIVLACTLLFDTEPGSLVLVDEPELSLHVSWQRQFLQILEEIIALNPVDVVIATHSPQIVYDRRDLMVNLGPVE